MILRFAPFGCVSQSIRTCSSVELRPRDTGMKPLPACSCPLPDFALRPSTIVQTYTSARLDVCLYASVCTYCCAALHARVCDTDRASALQMSVRPYARVPACAPARLSFCPAVCTHAYINTHAAQSSPTIRHALFGRELGGHSGPWADRDLGSQPAIPTKFDGRGPAFLQDACWSQCWTALPRDPTS